MIGGAAALSDRAADNADSYRFAVFSLFHSGSKTGAVALVEQCTLIHLICKTRFKVNRFCGGEVSLGDSLGNGLRNSGVG